MQILSKGWNVDNWNGVLDATEIIISCELQHICGGI